MDLDQQLLDLGFETDGITNFLHIDDQYTIEWDGIGFYIYNGKHIDLKGVETIEDVKLLYKLLTSKNI